MNTTLSKASEFEKIYCLEWGMKRAGNQQTGCAIGKIMHILHSEMVLHSTLQCFRAQFYGFVYFVLSAFYPLRIQLSETHRILEFSWVMFLKALLITWNNWKIRLHRLKCNPMCVLWKQTQSLPGRHEFSLNWFAEIIPLSVWQQWNMSNISLERQ